MYKIVETREYKKWFFKQTVKDQGQIQARILRIENDNYFGVAKRLTTNLAELKWASGRRVYFTTSLDKDGSIIILLLGGNKKTQTKDILKAKYLLKEISKKDTK